jgi:hypothetical protein
MDNLYGGNFISLAKYNTGIREQSAIDVKFYYEVNDTDYYGNAIITAGLALDCNILVDQTLINEEWVPPIDKVGVESATYDRDYKVIVRLDASSSGIYEPNFFYEINLGFKHSDTYYVSTENIGEEYFTGGQWHRKVDCIYRQWVIQEEKTFPEGVLINGQVIIANQFTDAVIKTYPVSFRLTFGDGVVLVPENDIIADNQFLRYTLYNNSQSTLAETYVELVRNDDKSQVIIPRKTITGNFNTHNDYLEWTDESLALLYEYMFDKTIGNFYYQIGYRLVGETEFTMARAVPIQVILEGVPLEPQIVCSAVDINPTTIALTGNPSYIVRYHSNLEIEATATPVKGAQIVSQRISTSEGVIVGNYYLSKNTTVSAVRFTATDSRGLTSIWNKSASDFIPYVGVSCNMTDIGLPTLDDKSRIILSGMYWDGSFGKVDNSLTFYYRYKSTSIPDYVEWIKVTKVELEFGPNNNYNAIFDVDLPNHIDRFTIQVKAVDKLESKESQERSVRAYPIFDWGEHDFHFNIPVIIDGDLQVNGVITSNTPEAQQIEPADYIIEQGTRQTGSGNSLANWTFRKWNSGMYECWCRKHIQTGVSTAWGNMYVSGALPHTNLIWPGAFIDIPVANITIAPNASGAFLIAGGSTNLTATNTGGYEIARGTSLSSGNFYINYYGMGRWK